MLIQTGGLPKRNKAMSLLPITVMGNPLILCCDKDSPPDTHRIGTVPIYFQNSKATVYIKIFGSLKIYEDKKLREEFEKELRRCCENPAVIEQIIDDYNGGLPRSKRFNPSIAQQKRGWYTGHKTVH